MTWVAVDCETTGLDPTRHEPWEIALVEADGTEHRWFVQPRALTDAEPGALRISRYYERTVAIEPPDLGGYGSAEVRGVHDRWCNRQAVAHTLAQFTAGCQLVASNPAFDARMLEELLRRHDLVPAWDYHLIDLGAMAYGWLHGIRHEAHLARQDIHDALPWRSDDLSLACGVEPPAAHERHTALGDARWAWRWFRRLCGIDAQEGLDR